MVPACASYFCALLGAGLAARKIRGRARLNLQTLIVLLCPSLSHAFSSFFWRDMSSTGRAGTRHGWTHRKRSGPTSVEPEVVIEQQRAEIDELRARLAALEQPLVVQAAGVYNMDQLDDKLLLADALWTGQWTSTLPGLREANPELVHVLGAQLKNSYHPTPHLRERAAATKARLLDGILSCMARAHSQKAVTALSAALAVLAECNSTSDEFWDATASFFRGSLTSNSWVEGFMKVAVPRRPPPPAGSINGVLLAVFDNLTMKCNYGAYFRDGETGIQLDMTTWLWTSLPPVLAPGLNLSNFDINTGIFRTDISLSSFCRLFSLHNPEILANKAARWKRFLTAAGNGTLLNRPSFVPAWRPYKIYEPPIWHRLQSSYEDVRAELEIMRDTLKGRYPDLKILFVAGDGLSLMRMNALLHNEQPDWIDKAPVIIPVQGEHPHGIFHAMHCLMRLYRAFLTRCAEVVECDAQISMEPQVSKFNVHRFFFLQVVTRASAEYLKELGRTPGADDLDDPVPILAKAKPNVNFSWLVHFLYDGGFFILDFLQSVRGNESHTIDTLWREFFAYAHTDTGHKTQYVPMAIMRVFWGMCLTSELDALYHKIRTAPTNSKHPGSNVGWDMLIEWLNHAIKQHVTSHITQAQIENFIRNWPFMETVRAGIRDAIYGMRTDRDYRWRDADADVEKLKKFFREKIGADWTTATRVNNSPSILKAGMSTSRPWLEVERKMGERGAKAPHVFVRSTVNRYTGFFPWQA